MTRQIIRTRIENVHTWFTLSDLAGSTEKIKKTLELIDEKAHQCGFDNAEIELERYGYDGGVDVYISGERLENDKEYKARLKMEELESKKAMAAKIKKEAREKKTYERLKAKFASS